MSAALICDDPEWMMPGLPHVGPSPRRLRIWRLNDAPGTLMAVITERGPGTSVTEIAEHAYAQVLAEHPSQLVRVVEHYPDDGQSICGEHFDEITVTAAGDPRWTPWERSEMIALVGEGVLDDMPPLPPDPDATVP